MIAEVVRRVAGTLVVLALWMFFLVFADGPTIFESSAGSLLAQVALSLSGALFVVSSSCFGVFMLMDGKPAKGISLLLLLLTLFMLVVVVSVWTPASSEAFKELGQSAYVVMALLIVPITALIDLCLPNGRKG